MSAATPGSGRFRLSTEAWVWWQARRLRYNLALGAAGLAAYALFVGLFYAFGNPLWKRWQDALSMTLFLGVAFLILMGAANVCYVLGPVMESLVKPSDVERYRKTTFAMGFWCSVALPFAFPAIGLANLIGQSAA
jgi:hypothetical protein